MFIKLTATQKMGFAALIMAGSVFLSRLMGLIRDKVISWQFGAGSESDIYFAAFIVPDFLNHLLAGGYISITLIPLLSKCFTEDTKDGWRFFSAVFWWASLGMGLLTLIAWIFAPELATLVAPGFSPDEKARLNTFLRIILPAQLFFLPGACVSALLYIRKQFFIPALTPLIYNGCILAGGLLFPGQGMEGFCWGVLIGAGLGAFVLPVLAARSSTGTPTEHAGLLLLPILAHPLLKRLLFLALPLMLGLSVVVMDEQFVRIFGSLAGEGAISLLSYARRIMLVPVAVVAQAAGVASFPFLAALAAKGDDDGFNTTLASALRGCLMVVIPLIAYMIVVAWPTLGFIFQGGRFSSEQALAAAPLLQLLLLSVPFWVVQQIIGRAFYARQNTLTPAVVGTLVTVATIPMYPPAIHMFGAGGVALLSTIGLAAYTLALGVAWAHKHGTAVFAGTYMLCLKLVVLSIPGTVLAFSAVTALPSILPDLVPTLYTYLPEILHYAIILACAAIAFAVPYLGFAWVFMPEAMNIHRRHS